MGPRLSNVSRRLINWFVYNFWFAFFPLTASVTLHYLGGKALRGALVSSPEILFFVIMTGATALGNLSESESIRAVGWGLWVMVLRALLLCGAISATFLYGILLYESIIGPSSPEIRERLLTLSVPMAIMFFVLGIAVEIAIGRAEDRRVP